MWKGWALFSGSVCNHFRSSAIAWSGSMFVYIESASDVKRYAALDSGLSFVVVFVSLLSPVEGFLHVLSLVCLVEHLAILRGKM